MSPHWRHPRRKRGAGSCPCAWHRRLCRTDREARLSAGTRRHRAVAVAVLSVARPRRWLRHRRLWRHQSRFRHDEGLQALHPGGQEARPARHHRTRRQPHLGPASVVQARAPQPAEFERAQLVCLERHRPEIPRYADHLHRYREVELDLGSGSRPVLLAPLLLAPAGPQFRQSPRGAGHRAGDETLARHRRRRLPAASATAPTTRICRRRMPSSSGCARSSTPMPRARSCWPRPINGRRTCRSISAMATNATWPITSR